LNATEHVYTNPPNYPPNIIAEIKGAVNPDKIVLLGAHIDCRAQNINDPTMRAPGANDDASGTAAIYEAARVFAASGLQFNYTIQFAAFTGEEQGLHGSTGLARDMQNDGEDIVAMIQSDMIAHRFPEAPNKMELTTVYASEALNREIEDIANLYVPSLEIGRTTACCSDQQPFHTRGYLATALVEAGGYTIDPMYHTSGDVVHRDDFSMDQLTLITQVLVASAADFAQPL